MEMTVSASKVDSALLDLFWEIADPKDDKRIQATQSILKILSEKQGNSEDDICPELKYTLGRLVKGLASNRKLARPGFSVVLTQILRQYSTIQVSHVLQHVKESLSASKRNKNSKQEQADAVLAQVMAFLALIQSDKIAQASAAELRIITEKLCALGAEKLQVKEICVNALVQMASKLPEGAFTKSVWPVVQGELQSGWENCGPDTLFLLLMLAKSQPGCVSKSFLSTHWGSKNIVCEKNLPHLVSTLSAIQAVSPAGHSVCPEVVRRLLKKDQLFAHFWKQVDVDLAVGTKRRKFFCLQLVTLVFQNQPTQDQVETVLSTNIITFLMKSLANKTFLFYAPAKILIDKLVEFVDQCTDPQQELAILNKFLCPPVEVEFDRAAKNTTVSTMARKLSVDGSRQLGKLLMKNILGEQVFGSQSGDVAWAVQMLKGLVMDSAALADQEWQKSILQFLFLHGFFQVTETSADIAHCQIPADAEALYASLRQQLQQVLFKSLDSLAVYRPEGAPRKNRRYLDILYGIAQYAQTLLQNQEYVKPIKELSAKALKEWQKVMTAVETIREKYDSEEKVGEATAFQLLFLHLGLQLFTEPKSAIEALDDLHLCQERAFAKKRRRSVKKVDDGEPEWVEVVTELLLSLLSQSSHLVRVVVKNVFSLLIPHLTRTSLDVIFNILNPKEGEGEDALAFEDDEEESDMEEEEEEVEEGDEEKEKSKEEEEEEEDEESEDEEEEEGAANEDVDEQLRSSVKAALGEAAADSENEDEGSDSDMSDSEMYRLDKVLADIFRQRHKAKTDKKEQQKQLLRYRTCCLDLLKMLAKANVSYSMVLELIFPLLMVIDGSLKDHQQRSLRETAMHILHDLYKSKSKYFHDPELEQDKLAGLAKQLIEFSAKVPEIPLSREIANACIFVMYVLETLQSNSDPSPVKTRAKRAEKEVKESNPLSEVVAVIEEALFNFLEKRDSHYHSSLFHTILEKRPVVLWDFSHRLLDVAVNPDIRIYCRTQAFSMLSVLLNKRVVREIGNEKWLLFSEKLISTTPKGLDGVLKPRYIQELLVVLNKHSVVSPKPIQLSSELLDKIEGAMSSTSFEQVSKKLAKKLLRAGGRNVDDNPQKQGKKRKSDENENQENGDEDDDGENGSPSKKKKGAALNGVDSPQGALSEAQLRKLKKINKGKKKNKGKENAGAKEGEGEGEDETEGDLEVAEEGQDTEGVKGTEGDSEAKEGEEEEGESSGKKKKKKKKDIEENAEANGDSDGFTKLKEKSDDSPLPKKSKKHKKKEKKANDIE